MKIIKYFFQAIIIYVFFFIGKLLGLNISRKVFSFIFSNIAPNFKSKKIIEKNLITFKNDLSDFEKEKIINSMWKNYGKTFIEYIF